MAGRKSWEKELDMKALWDLSIPVLKKALRSTSPKRENQRIQIALALTQKMMPQPIEEPMEETELLESQIVFANIPKNGDGEKRFKEYLN
jgi:hypothetical protein